MAAEIAQMRRLLDAAREAGAPVAFSVTAYHADGSDGAAPSLNAPGVRTMREGTRAVEVDERLGRRDGEPVLVKKTASSFFGTHLQSIFTRAGVDTVIVCGCTTSGCVRATATDANALGFRTIVPIETTADRARGPHLASLYDMDAKLADVVPLEEALAALRQP
jgi:nicotinamidase-related amidase